MDGTLREGRFVCLGTLGEGSQGRTFDGLDKVEGRPVAIKRFDVRGAKGWKDVELAEREARVLKSLSHPKLPRYVDHFEEDGALYLVMEKIEGESLASLRKRGVLFGEEEVTRLLHDAAEVLDYLHSLSPPVVHRDLKPGNVIRRPDGSFAFVDFGAVRDRLRPEGGSTVVGTFGYMAPEQFQGRALPASDVYAIGATAMAMLTGAEPEDLPHRGLGIRVREALGGRVSERLARALELMLDPDPDTRARRIDPASGYRGRPARDQARSARSARRAERRARRASRSRVHWPLEIVFTLVFALGIVWVSIATQIVVPLLLRMLSLFFARSALVSAADAVRDAGARAVDGMSRSRRWMRRENEREAGSEEESTPAPRTRVGMDDEAGQVRVAEGEDDADEAQEGEGGPAERRTRGNR
ncbi:MAG: serine/threonine protein kinase [Polyangiaceae bacterium]|jgi:hypothetical protein